MSTQALQLLAVGGGGAIGALCRYALSQWFAHSYPNRFNSATVVANVLGSLVIGAAYVFIVEKAVLPEIYRHLVMVGFLGAFTTFSTFSLEAFGLMQNGQWGGAMIYVLTSVVLSLVAVTAGYLLAQSLTG